MSRRFDHIDLRVPDLEEVRPFYSRLLPALGFSEDVSWPDWIQFVAPGEGGTEFFGVTQDPDHRPNQNRIAFWAESTEEVDRVAALLHEIGAQNIEGPDWYEGDFYYVVFFEDPAGNRLELCHRYRN